MTMSRPLLRPSEAADILGVCERTLRKYRTDYGLPWVQVTHGTIRYKMDDLLDFQHEQYQARIDVIRDREEAARDHIREPSRHLADKVYDRDGQVCSYCGDTEGPFQIDHIHPWSKGGKTKLSNLTVACRSCNASKRDRTLAEWKGRDDR